MDTLMEKSITKAELQYAICTCHSGSEGAPCWEAAIALPAGTLPIARNLTLQDVDGICWPDVVGEAVCRYTGAINSSELISINTDVVIESQGILDCDGNEVTLLTDKEGHYWSI